MQVHLGRLRHPVTPPVAVSVVRDLDDLENLRSHPQKLLSSRRICLELESLDARQVRYFERRLNQLAAACGCESGATFAVIALAGYIGYVLLTTGWHPRWSVSSGAWGVAVFLVGAVLGKLVGLVRARARLVRELEHLAARLQHPTLIVDR